MAIITIYSPMVAIVEDAKSVLSIGELKVGQSANIKVSTEQDATYARRFISQEAYGTTIKGYVTPADAARYGAIGENLHRVTQKTIDNKVYKEFPIYQGSLFAPFDVFDEKISTFKNKYAGKGKVDSILFAENKLEVEEVGENLILTLKADKVTISYTGAEGGYPNEIIDVASKRILIGHTPLMNAITPPWGA